MLHRATRIVQIEDENRRFTYGQTRRLRLHVRYANGALGRSSLGFLGVANMFEMGIKALKAQCEERSLVEDHLTRSAYMGHIREQASQAVLEELMKMRTNFGLADQCAPDTPEFVEHMRQEGWLDGTKIAQLLAERGVDRPAEEFDTRTPRPEGWWQKACEARKKCWN